VNDLTLIRWIEHRKDRNHGQFLLVLLELKFLRKTVSTFRDVQVLKIFISLRLEGRRGDQHSCGMWHHDISLMLTPLKLNRLPLKSYLPKRKFIFQPSFFRCELSNFGGGILFCNIFLLTIHHASGSETISAKKVIESWTHSHPWLQGENRGTFETSEFGNMEPYICA